MAKIRLMNFPEEKEVTIKRDFSYVQFTYELIKVEINNSIEDIGYLDKDGYWKLFSDKAKILRVSIGPWTDITIF